MPGKKARVLTAEVYRLTRVDSFRRDRGLVDQMRRAAVSVMSNIAEGFDRGTSRELYRYLSIAKGSCADLLAHFYVADDAGHITETEFNGLVVATEQVSRIIGGLQASIKNRTRQ